MEIIDSHAHLMWGDPAALMEVSEAFGFSRVNVLSCACAEEFGGPLSNLWMLAAKVRYPERIYGFGGIVHPRPGERVLSFERQAALWLAAGADGMKFLETKPTLQAELGVDLSDGAYDPMWALLEARGTPIVWHVGDPATFWREEDAPAYARENGLLYLDARYPSLERLYAQAESVLDRHPRLRASLAHFYFTADDPDHARHMLEEYPYVCFDLTPGTEMYEHFAKAPEFWRAFFLRYSDRILFGTDDTEPEGEAHRRLTGEIVGIIRSFLETSGPFQVWDLHFHGIGLPPAALETIYGGNFHRLAGEIRPVDRGAAAAAVDWTLSLLRSRGEEDALRQAEACARVILGETE